METKSERVNRQRREWYYRNRESSIDKVSNRKKEIKTWFRNYKEELSCSNCGFSHPAVIDFHHKDSKTKDDNVAFMVANGNSIEKILHEIEKCEVLCANCHRIYHFNDR